MSFLWELNDTDTSSQLCKRQAPPTEDNSVIREYAKRPGWADFWCALAILGCWLGMSALGIAAGGGLVSLGMEDLPGLPSGDPLRLVSMVDYEGKVCGQGANAGRRYGYFMPFGGPVCVEECPLVNNFSDFVCINDPPSLECPTCLGEDRTAVLHTILHNWTGHNLTMFDPAYYNATTEEFYDHVPVGRKDDWVPYYHNTWEYNYDMYLAQAYEYVEEKLCMPHIRTVPRFGRCELVDRHVDLVEATRMQTYNDSALRNATCAPTLKVEEMVNCTEPSFWTESTNGVFDLTFPQLTLPRKFALGLRCGSDNCTCLVVEDWDCSVSLMGNTTYYPYVPPMDVWETSMSDLYVTSGHIMLFGIVVSSALGLVHMALVRSATTLAFFTWVLIALVELLLAASVVALWVTRSRWLDEDDTYSEGDLGADPSSRTHSRGEADALLWLLCPLLVSAFLWAYGFFRLRRRIELSVGMFYEAGKAVGDIRFMPLFPLAMVAGMAAFVATWTVYMTHLGAGGEATVVTWRTYVDDDELWDDDDRRRDSPRPEALTYKVFAYSGLQALAGAFLAFMFYWTTQFIVAFGGMTVSYAVASWYFCKNRSEEIVGKPHLLAAFHLIKDCHLGTAALGGLIVPVCELAQYALGWYYKRVRRLYGGKRDNVSKACMNMALVWAWHLDTWCKFINRHAYVMVAIKGLGLFRGGRIAYYLMGRNLDRLMPTFVVVTPYLLIGKLLVSTLATLLCWVALYTDAATMRNLYGLWVPLVGTFGCAWLVAECFSLVHEYAIWAMLQCFILDEEMYGHAKHFGGGTLEGDTLTEELKAVNIETEIIAVESTQKGSGFCGRHTEQDRLSYATKSRHHS